MAANRIRICTSPDVFQEHIYDNAYVPDEPDYQTPAVPPLQYGERVVWMSDHGPEYGTVMWIGILPDSRDRDWTVGVEFVSIDL